MKGFLLLLPRDGALDRVESLGAAVVRNPHLHVGRMHDGMLPNVESY